MKPSAIVVYEIDEAKNALVDELVGENYEVTPLSLGKGILSKISQIAPCILIFQIKAPNKNVLELIKLINFSAPQPIIVFAKEHSTIHTDEFIKVGVSSYIVDGYKAGRLKSIIDIALARFSEYQAINNELNVMREKLEDRKLIDKAKGMLMQLRNISEDDAYKSMRKMAMENNKRLVDIAKNILSVSHSMH